MPRLIGGQSNNSWYVTLVLILTIAAAGSLDYLDIVNVIPGFDADRPLNNQSSFQIDGAAHGRYHSRNGQHRSVQTIETKRIQAALGRPVTCVILGQQNQVILNVGELITHQTIASARQAQVLDLLLNSVHTGSPQLSLDDLRAPQPGIAAL